MENIQDLRFTDSHQFNVGIAQKYGVEEAIIIQHFHFWIEKNEANGKNFHDGKYWTFNSAKAFSKVFPYWSAKSIARKLNDMEARGLIISGNYNEDERDRSKWYSLSESVQCIFHFCPTHLPKASNSFPESVQPLPDSKPDINTDIKESKEKVSDKPKRAPNFVPPKIDEVKAYCQDRKNGLDPELWYDHYQSNGWMVGKTKMKDWKAAVRTWEKRNVESPGAKPKQQVRDPWEGADML